MSNTIDINLGGENNSMNSLSFHWFVILKDGTKINQFDEDGKEHRFKEVKDKFDELVYFNLTNKCGKMFTVNLEQGIIGYNYLVLPYIKSKETKTNIRLIFFRRHTVSLTLNDLKEKQHDIIYFLGLQYNNKLGNNQKIILQIDEQGNFIIGDTE